MPGVGKTQPEKYRVNFVMMNEFTDETSEPCRIRKEAEEAMGGHGSIFIFSFIVSYLGGDITSLGKLALRF